MRFSPTWAIKLLTWNDSPSLLEVRRQRNKQNLDQDCQLRLSSHFWGAKSVLASNSCWCFWATVISVGAPFWNDASKWMHWRQLIRSMPTKSVSLRTYSNSPFSVPGHVKVRRRSGTTSVAEDEHGKNFAPVQGLSNWFTLPIIQDTIIKPLFFSCMCLLPSPTLTHYKVFVKSTAKGLQQILGASHKKQYGIMRYSSKKKKSPSCPLQCLHAFSIAPTQVLPGVIVLVHRANSRFLHPCAA